MTTPYHPGAFEPRVQARWEAHKLFHVRSSDQKEKYYCLSMFPYPSGSLHIGHVRNYVLSDVDARFQRMRGKSVLHPIGWDAFGLPAENAAIAYGCSPQDWIKKNIESMKWSLKRLGLSFDWSRELNCSEPEYYRWEQWLFLKLYKRGLAYQKQGAVNFCPQDQTVLANEQVVEGRCWRCEAPVQKKYLNQWFLRLTDYADELLEGIQDLTQWPAEVKAMQRHWIGRTEGLEIRFSLQTKEGTPPDVLAVYTTCPETIFGVSYLAISPMHPLAVLAAESDPKLASWLEDLGKEPLRIESELCTREMKGYALPFNARHPYTQLELPVWIANFVLERTGEGAVMAVPAHDARDHAFATKYGLPMPVVIVPEGGDDAACPEPSLYKGQAGRMINSGKFSGLSVLEARHEISEHAIQRGFAWQRTNLRIQDWGISRQRYWGTPIPMLQGLKEERVAVDLNALPVTLPSSQSFSLGQNPLIADQEWRETVQDGVSYKRVPETFDTFMESSWYYARYTCPDFHEGILDPQKTRVWLPVDHYIGGIEHATMHLIYFRFMHKVLRDLGLVHTDEPVKRLTCQGMVLSDAFYRQEGHHREWVPLEEVKVTRDAQGRICQSVDRHGVPVVHAGLCKMSKSKKNGIDPVQMIEKYGADTVRFAILFAAPPQAALEWQGGSMVGAQRFLQRLWTTSHEIIELLHSDIEIMPVDSNQRELLTRRDALVAKVTQEYSHRFYINVALAAIMEFCNEFFGSIKSQRLSRRVMKETLQILLQLLNPVMPHVTATIWEFLDLKGSIEFSNWPTVEDEQAHRKRKVLIIQLNGKKIGILDATAVTSKIEAIQQAQSDPAILKRLDRLSVKSTHYRPNQVINFVTQKTTQLETY